MPSYGHVCGISMPMIRKKRDKIMFPLSFKIEIDFGKNGR